MNGNSKKVKGGIFSAKWYYLIFFLMTIVGWGMVFAFPASFAIGALGAAIGTIGVYSLIGAPIEKYTYSETKIVKLDSGEEVKCTLIRKRQHFASLILFRWLSIFYFIPLGTQYFIASNLDRAEDTSGKVFVGAFEEWFDYCNCEQITKKRYKELMDKPQLYKDELAQRLLKQKEVFFEVIKKFEQNNLVEREICTDSYAIYKLSDNMIKYLGDNSSDNGLRIKFNFTGDNESQKGFLAAKSLLEKGISYAAQFPFEKIINGEYGNIAGHYIELNNDLFSTLMIHKGVNENTESKFVDIDQLEEIKGTDKRNVLTKDIVCSVARNKRKGGLLLLCILAYYFAVPFVVCTVLSLFIPNILGFICCLAISVALIWLAEYARRKNKVIARTPKIEELEIVKTYCDKEELKNENNTTVHIYTFGNGLVLTDKENKYKLTEKTICYIIYRKPENDIRWIYSSDKVKLSPDLNVTDATQEQ